MAAYQLTVERHADYLHFTVAGDNTPATVLRYMGEVRSECLRADIFDVLLVVNLEGPGISMLEVYKVIAAAVDSSVGLGIRVAYVDLNPLHSEANMLLAENVAMTRGIPVRTFRHVDEARTWLVAHASDSPTPKPA